MGRGGEPSPSAVPGKAPASRSPEGAKERLPVGCQLRTSLGFSGTPLSGARHALTLLQKVLFVVTHLVNASFLNIRPRLPSISQQVLPRKSHDNRPPPTPAACTRTHPHLYSHRPVPGASAHVSSLLLMAQGHIKLQTPKLGLSPSFPTAPTCCSLNDPQNCSHQPLPIYHRRQAHYPTSASSPTHGIIQSS